MQEIFVSAALAVAYAETIRRVPETAGGFGKLAAKHRARVAALAEELNLGADRGETDTAPVVLAVVHRR